MSKTPRHTIPAVPVSAADLPLHCPLPDAPLWARHPRVFLDINQTGSVTCPYCSTHYEYQGPAPTGHHPG